MRFKQAIQIGDNVTDIMKLPCVVACIKKDDGNGFHWLEYRVKCLKRGMAKYGEEGDWIVLGDNGWNVITDDEYKQSINH